MQKGNGTKESSNFILNGKQPNLWEYLKQMCMYQWIYESRWSYWVNKSYDMCSVFFSILAREMVLKNYEFKFYLYVHLYIIKAEFETNVWMLF